MVQQGTEMKMSDTFVFQLNGRRTSEQACSFSDENTLDVDREQTVSPVDLDRLLAVALLPVDV